MTTMYVVHFSCEKIFYVSGLAKVVNIDEGMYQDQITVRIEQDLYHIYHKKDEFRLGDIYHIKGNIEIYRGQTTPYGFNLYKHFYAEGIEGIILYDEMNFVKNEFSFYKFRDILKDALEDYQSKPYLELFFFGKTDDKNDFYDTYQSLGLLFLLSASGIHLYVMIEGVKKLLRVMNIKDNHQDLIIMMMLCLFLYLDQFQVGSTRLCLYYFFGCVSRYKKLHFEKLDLLHITFLCMLILNFKWIYSTSFLMTYLLFHAIYLVEPLIEHKHTYLKHVYMALIIQLVLLPFFDKTSIMLVLSMPIFIFFFSKIYTPFLCLVLLIKPLDSILFSFLNDLNYILSMLASKNFFIEIPHINLYLGILYVCLCLMMFCYKDMIKKIICACLIILMMISVGLYRTHQSQIIFLDVGQGDGTIITHQGCVIVIDAYENVDETLKGLGTKDIDYLILTHGDIDHMKEAEVLINHFKVKKLVLSEYDDYGLFHHALVRVKAHDVISCKDLNMDILGPLKNYQSSNNNSIVLKFMLKNKTFLFTGDIEKEAELDLVQYYDLKLKSDVLKVSHHGSITSSTEAFLSKVLPRIAVISLGYQNKFSFPHDSVIDRLMHLNIQIYRTDHHGTIHFLPSKKKEKWRTYIPYRA